jgi:hypothetical protein
LKVKKADDGILKTDELLKAIFMVFNVLLHKNLNRLQGSAATGKSLIDTWNGNQPYLQELARFFGVVLMAEQMVKRLETAQAEVKQVAEKVVQLFMVDNIVKHAGELIAFGYCGKEAYEKYESFFNQLCFETGDSAVRIIDAIADEDFMHGIPIGHSDGQGYQRLCSQIESQADCYKAAPWTSLTKELLDYKTTNYI